MSAKTSGALGAERLRRTSDPTTFDFETTAELEPLREHIGQEPAMRAVRFGLGVDHPGYNIFATGLPGSGRTSMIRQLLLDRAMGEPAASDWCYVHNFDVPREPRVLELPAGSGQALRDDVKAMLTELQTSLPKALQAEEFRKETDEITSRAVQTQRQLVEDFQSKIANVPHVTLVQTPAGFTIVGAIENEPVDETRFQALPEERREEILNHRRELQHEFAHVQRAMRDAEREAMRLVVDLRQKVAHGVVTRCIGELKARWESVPPVVEHLERLQREIVENADDFASTHEDGGYERRVLEIASEDPLARYRVNPLVCHDGESGAPVVLEEYPTYHNLVGRIEHRVQFGTMVADFNQITAGALHRANGGYLILEAGEVLRQPLAWIALKNALRTQAIRVEEMIEQSSLIATTTLKPQPIRLRCRVILIGDPYTYVMLHAYDDDFGELFKVKADFSPYMTWDAEGERKYGRFIAARCAEESLLPFEAAAVARVIEFGSRVAEDQERLTTRFGRVADLVREAGFFSRAERRAAVSDADVQRAIRERVQRVNRAEREILELIEKDILAVEPSGATVGQIYGLAVLQASEHAFARPIKVEASAFMGTSGVVDIEREVRLGGPLHNKGVLVLSGYLGDLFAQEHPLIMSASLSFDQLYEEVEGDSASAAELYALVSAIAGVPIRQGIAVTGAINQKGDVQPIGGVTTKIEGFFHACERRGLTGEQGVVIPQRNITNLVLNDELIDAVRNGKFHIWPIRQVEEGWEILTGVPAGERTDDGFPEESVYGRAARRLWEWAQGWRNFGRPVRKGRDAEAEGVADDAS